MCVSPVSDVMPAASLDNILDLYVHLIAHYQIYEHDILKTSNPVLLQNWHVWSSGPQGQVLGSGGQGHLMLKLDLET